MPYCFCTHEELSRINKSFGHSSVYKMGEVLKRWKGEGNLDDNTRAAIDAIKNVLDSCKRYEQAPCQFKLTIGANELRFNHCVPVDTMFLNGRPVIHMIDEATTKERLQLEVFALQESYERGELSRIGWIPGAANVEDALTKPVLYEKSPLF